MAASTRPSASNTVRMSSCRPSSLFLRYSNMMRSSSSAEVTMSPDMSELLAGMLPRAMSGLSLARDPYASERHSSSSA